MSTENWYLRDRDKVTGPHSRDDLEALRRRGRLSQILEVSRDREHWVSVGTLFGPGAEEAAPKPSGWYYSSGQSSTGPVSREAILSLLKSGKIDANTRLWKNGLPDWIPLRESELYFEAAPVMATATSTPSSRNTKLWLAAASGVSGVLMAVIAGLAFALLRSGAELPQEKPASPVVVVVQPSSSGATSPPTTEGGNMVKDYALPITQGLKNIGEAFDSAVRGRGPK